MYPHIYHLNENTGVKIADRIESPADWQKSVICALKDAKKENFKNKYLNNSVTSTFNGGIDWDIRKIKAVKELCMDQKFIDLIVPYLAYGEITEFSFFSGLQQFVKQETLKEPMKEFTIGNVNIKLESVFNSVMEIPEQLIILTNMAHQMPNSKSPTTLMGSFEKEFPHDLCINILNIIKERKYIKYENSILSESTLSEMDKVSDKYYNWDEWADPAAILLVFGVGQPNSIGVKIAEMYNATYTTASDIYDKVYSIHGEDIEKMSYHKYTAVVLDTINLSYRESGKRLVVETANLMNLNPEQVAKFFSAYVVKSTSHIEANVANILRYTSLLDKSNGYKDLRPADHIKKRYSKFIDALDDKYSETHPSKALETLLPQLNESTTLYDDVRFEFELNEAMNLPSLEEYLLNEEAKEERESIGSKAKGAATAATDGVAKGVGKVADAKRNADVKASRAGKWFDNILQRKMDKFKEAEKKKKEDYVIKGALSISHEITRALKTLPFNLIHPGLGYLLYLTSVLWSRKLTKEQKAQSIRELKTAEKIVDELKDDADRNGNTKEKIKYIQEKDRIIASRERIERLM